VLSDSEGGAPSRAGCWRRRILWILHGPRHYAPRTPVWLVIFWTFSNRLKIRNRFVIGARAVGRLFVGSEKVMGASGKPPGRRRFTSGGDGTARGLEDRHWPRGSKQTVRICQRQVESGWKLSFDFSLNGFVRPRCSTCFDAHESRPANRGLP
jgi:hypothetical protein